MKLTQFLSFEICTGCNLGAEHKECPNQSPERWALLDHSRPITDDLIMAVAESMYRDHGFTGAIAWHYYNEPLLARDRMLALMARIKAAIPAARFCLWTNGELIPADCDWLKAFDFCWVTNYHGKCFRHVTRHIPRTKVVRWQLDRRLQAKQSANLNPCGRMFSEFIIDHFGNVHACCIDWRGEIKLGNVWDESLDVILPRWIALRESIAIGKMTDDAPDVCRRCSLRHGNVSALVPDIAARATTEVKHMAKARHDEERRAMNLLAVATITRPTADAPEVKRVDIDADKAQVFTGWKAAADWIRASGSYFGVILKDTQTMTGPIRQALQLHPNENKLIVKCKGLDGKPRADVIIAKLAEVQSWIGAAPVYRRGLPIKPIVLAELAATDTAQASGKRLAVTFTHYRLPAARLADHFTWNHRLYAESGACVFIVTDRQYDVPAYARCLVYPEPMQTFSLAQTSNYGIRFAADCGFDVIIKTDVDMAYDERTWQAMIDPSEGVAIVPVYHMADNWAERSTRFVLAPAATGTISMITDDWRKAHFHEGCTGYGCDDGILLKDIQRQKIRQDRTGIIYHIAHVAGTPQKEFNQTNPRIDHWNRDTGFNPENFSGNRRLHHRRDTSPAWGLPAFSGLTIVATHYAMPESRLMEWLEWNGALFESNHVRAIIVSDRSRSGLPDWLRVAVYPVPLHMFNLSATSNYGIRLAAFGLICKTDIDCAFSQAAIDAMMAVTPIRGISPRYYMAASYAAREQSKSTWDASKGTMCLHWDHWAEARGFNERLQGYGIEDGECFERCRQLPGRTVERVQLPFWHVAHSDAKQSQGNSRKDCWNRSSGFNPRNHGANAAALRLGAWADDGWGIPGGA